MAPASTERERTHRSSHHHHHRTISSTTLLLALSLILAVLAITLTIPSLSSTASDPVVPGGLLGYFTPKRTQGLVAREGAVALREAEVARREADLLAGSPAGVAVPSITNCAAWPTLSVITQTVTVEVVPTSTIYKEVPKEVDTIGSGQAPPAWWKDSRMETLFDREQRVSEREKDVGSREETVGKRETDAARREQWIMDQLM